MDQLVLGILFSSLSDLILGHVLSSTIASELWTSLASMFAFHSQAKEFQLHFQLMNLSKGDQSISNYFIKTLPANQSRPPTDQFVNYATNMGMLLCSANIALITPINLKLHTLLVPITQLLSHSLSLLGIQTMPPQTI